MNNPVQVTLEEAIKLAKQHHQSGNLILAERTYKDIIAAFPDHFETLHMLGVIAYQRGNIREALRLVTQAHDLNPDDAECINNLAIMQSENGDKELAIKTWTRALEKEPNKPEVLSNLSHTYWQLHEFKEAKENAQKAIEFRPNYASAWLNLGNAMQGLEEFEKAIEAWEKVVELEPQNSPALSNIGNIHRELGQLAKSEEYGRQATEADPNNANAWSNLGNALRDLSKPAEAETCYRTAIRLRPNFVQAQNNLAISLMDQFRFEEAVEAARYATAFDENYGDAWQNLSFALREMGEFDQALEAAEKAVLLKPDSADAHADLSDVLFVQDRIDEAEAALEEAQRLAPESPRIYLRLANILERAGKIAEALETIAKAVELNPEMPEAYHKKAQILFFTNQLDAALEAINKVIELMPETALPLGTKAEILISQNKLEEAEKLLREAMLYNNRLPSLYLSLSKIHKFTKDDPDFQHMERLATGVETMGRNATTSMSFAMFDAYEDFGEYDKAFEFLKQGNDLKRTIIPYNPQINYQIHKNLETIYSDEYIDSLKDAGNDTEVPIFILGMPRSGTTLTEQILSMHPDVYAAGELMDFSTAYQIHNEVKPENANEIGQIYLDRLTERYGKQKRITDKMPSNYLRLGDILMTLPNAKIIHCKRNPLDNCLSCYKQLFARGQYWSYNLQELAGQYNAYYRLMAFWREKFPNRFLDFDYEETVTDFETQARRLIEFTELEWNDACLEPHKSKRSVITASKTQVIKPVYQSSVKGWKRYEEQLQPLVDAINPDILKKYS
ncbi:MAG: tetratricopeptide repeat protein [Pseudomonadota bacterium]